MTSSVFCLGLPARDAVEIRQLAGHHRSTPRSIRVETGGNYTSSRWMIMLIYNKLTKPLCGVRPAIVAADGSLALFGRRYRGDGREVP
jgi:hypothetical protein